METGKQKTLQSAHSPNTTLFGDQQRMERIDKTKNQDQPDIQVIETGQVGEGQVLHVVDSVALQID